ALGLMRLGRILYELGDVDAGVTALDEAVRASDAGGDPRASGAARLARAFLHGEAGELEAAFRLLNEAAQAFQRVGMPLHVIEMAAADLQRRHGNAADAEKRLRAVADAFKKAGAAVQWAEAWFGVGRCLLDLGKAAEGTAAVQETAEIRQRSRDRFALVRTYEELARGLAAQGEAVAAFKALHQARRMAERLGMARRLGGVDAELDRLAPALKAMADLDAASVAAEAAATIDALEAAWAAQPEAPAQG
ncbi:MAG: hypothetical protein KC549_13900, partial [Myxococcales bacterium]|nr:hypothetical protein [Myxococcales bacterium]